MLVSMSQEPIHPEKILRVAADALREKVAPGIELHVECERGVRPVRGSLKTFVNSILCPALMVTRTLHNSSRLTILIRNCDIDKSFAAVYNDLTPGAYVEVMLEVFPATRSLSQLAPSLNKTVSPEGGRFVVHPTEDGSEVLLCFWPAATVDLPVGAPMKGAGELILVIDDEPGVLLLLVNALQSAGYRTLAAKDGATALDLFTRNVENISLVLTDIMMPGMNGHEIMHAITARYPSMKTLAISGFVSRNALARVQESGASAFLAKPFKLTRLLNTVHALLRKA